MWICRTAGKPLLNQKSIRIRRGADGACHTKTDVPLHHMLWFDPFTKQHSTLRSVFHVDMTTWFDSRYEQRSFRNGNYLGLPYACSSHSIMNSVGRESSQLITVDVLIEH